METMKRIVEFKYDLDDMIITPFNEKGIIEMLGRDEGGNKYYVKTKLNSAWYKEKELRN